MQGDESSGDGDHARILNGRLLRRIRDESGEAIMGGDSYARKKTKERSLTSPLSRFYRESSASHASFCGG